MNKSLITIAAVLILTLGAGGFLLLSKDDNSQNSPSDTTSDSSQNDVIETTKKEQPTAEQKESSANNTGSYSNYSEDALAQAEGDTYLFFHAPWCSQCRAIESDIVDEGVPDSVAIFKVDYDTNQELRKKYGITIQTTFVKIDKNGDKQGLYVAYNEPTFEAVKRDFIN